MASNLFLSNSSSGAMASSVNTASYFGSAKLVIFDGTQPTNCGDTATTILSTASPPTWNTGANTTNILAVFDLPAFASNSVTTNVLTFGAITNVTANRTGTATWFRVLNGATVNGAGNQITVAGTPIMDGNVGTSAADCNLNSTAISSGATVSVTSFTFTVTK